jgi:hypothetical protein
MAYSKSYLDKFLIQENYGTDEHKSVTQGLLDKLTSGLELSLAEEEYACSTMFRLRSAKGEFIGNIDKYNCKNFWFRNRYLSYWNDINGEGRVFDYKGEITLDQKEKDKVFLQGQYEEWRLIIYGKTDDDLIRYIANETIHHVNKINKYCKKNWIGSFRREYLIKSIIIYSKALYYIVKEYYEELGTTEEQIVFHDRTILLDSFSYVHTMFRHYSYIIKEYQGDKTYHSDENIDFWSIPNFLKNVIELFITNFDPNQLQQSINFIYNNKTYTLWLREYKRSRPGNVVELFQRVQSFYPVEQPVDILRVKKLTKVEIGEFIFLV